MRPLDTDRAVAVFRGVERTLLSLAKAALPPESVDKQLGKFRFSGLARSSDNDFYIALVDIVFYSGFRASTVTAKLPIIHAAFPDFRKVAGYSQADVAAILADPRMIRNRNKISACVHNAREFNRLVSSHGSIHAWIQSRVGDGSMDNLLGFREDLQLRLKGLGPTTSLHFMMDMGLPVLKPDRVICRLFYRLGLIEDESDTLAAVRVGRELALATGEPIRYIDIVCVAYGQAQTDELGLHRGICLSSDPACFLCGVREYCRQRGVGNPDTQTLGI